MKLSQSFKFAPVFAASIACSGEPSPLQSAVEDYVVHQLDRALNHEIHAACAEDQATVLTLPNTSGPRDWSCIDYDFPTDLNGLEVQRRVASLNSLTDELAAQAALDAATEDLDEYDCGFVEVGVIADGFGNFSHVARNMILLDDSTSRISVTAFGVTSNTWTKVDSNDERWKKFPATCNAWWRHDLQSLGHDFNEACKVDNFDFSPILSRKKWLLYQLGESSQKWNCEGTAPSGL